MLLVKAIFWDLLGKLGGNSKTLIHKEFSLFDHAFTALKKAQENEFINIIVTNQSHIAHGRITQSEYTGAMKKILDELKNNGISIKKVYTCPHKKQDNCQCKKPKTFFVEKAICTYDIDINKSYFIGDSGKNDILMANKVGLKSVLVMTGTMCLTRDEKDWGHVPTFIEKDSLAAVNRIVTEDEDH